MTGEQLNFDGTSVPLPIPKPRALTARQRDLVRYVRIYAGQDTPMPTRRAGLFFRDASGALRRLEIIGLVRRVKHGHWTAT